MRYALVAFNKRNRKRDKHTRNSCTYRHINYGENDNDTNGFVQHFRFLISHCGYSCDSYIRNAIEIIWIIPFCVFFFNNDLEKRKLISPWKLHLSGSNLIFVVSTNTPKYSFHSQVQCYVLWLNLIFRRVSFSLQSLFMVGCTSLPLHFVLMTFCECLRRQLTFLAYFRSATGDACAIDATPTGRRRMVETTCRRLGGETFYRDFSGIQISRSWTITRQLWRSAVPFTMPTGMSEHLQLLKKNLWINSSGFNCRVWILGKLQNWWSICFECRWAVGSHRSVQFVGGYSASNRARST